MMANGPRAVVICEWVLFSLLAVVFLVIALDLTSAMTAQNCQILPRAEGCYPWGGEGPAADAGWHYASKRNYLANSFYEVAVIATALASFLLLRPGGRIFGLLAVLVLLYVGESLLKLVVQVIHCPSRSSSPSR